MNYNSASVHDRVARSVEEIRRLARFYGSSLITFV